VAALRTLAGLTLPVLAFVLAPKTASVLLVFAAVMGVTFLSTAPPTAGLVARFSAPRTWQPCSAR